MKFSSIAALTLTLAPTAQCFSAMPRFNIANFLVEAARKRTKLEILEGVGLPIDTDIIPTGQKFSNFFELSGKANVDVIKSLTALGGESLSSVVDEELTKNTKKSLDITNPPKRNKHWRRVQTEVINEIIKTSPNAADPTEGYLYFGNQNFTKNLALLCQVNPFFASALTLSADKKYLELIAYQPEREGLIGKIKDVLRPEPKYLSIMRSMVNPNHRINCRFNLDMTMTQMTKFDEESGDEIIIPEEEWDYYSSGILYNLLYYSSAIHVNLHILHYLMCTAIQQCTSHSESLAAWAIPYDDNIAVKHLEVGALLMDCTLGGKPFLPTDAKVITGANGMGGSLAVKEDLKKILCEWGTFKSANDFKDIFLLGDLSYHGADESEIAEIVEKAGILTEARKHLANIQPFTEELTAVMEKSDKESFETAEKDLTEFMLSCGKDVSSIDSISSWVQLMSCTGLLHGSTLSYSRMAVVPEIMRWRDIKAKEWTSVDLNLIAAMPVTTQGMTESRHVFMSEGGEKYDWDTKQMDEDLKAVLDKYNEKANVLKAAYEAELEASNDLREYGWILTDHCTDGYDGKQHTITTYI